MRKPFNTNLKMFLLRLTMMTMVAMILSMKVVSVVVEVVEVVVVVLQSVENDEKLSKLARLCFDATSAHTKHHSQVFERALLVPNVDCVIKLIQNIYFESFFVCV